MPLLKNTDMIYFYQPNKQKCSYKSTKHLLLKKNDQKDQNKDHFCENTIKMGISVKMVITRGNSVINPITRKGSFQ